MNRFGLLLLAVLLPLASWGQTPPPGTISRPPSSETGSYTNETPPSSLGLGNLSVTNSSGATYSVAQLSSQLQDLRRAVDQALPVLMAFNETFSNSISGGHQTIGSEISDLLKGLSRKSSQNPGTASAQTSTNQLLNALENMLGTSASGTTNANPNTLRDLLNLQDQLRPVVSTLQDLGVKAGTATTPNSENRPLTPTGR